MRSCLICLRQLLFNNYGLFLPGGDHVPVRRAFDDTIPLDLLLKIQEPVETPVNGEVNKLPFDDPREPDESTHIVEPDRREHFI